MVGVFTGTGVLELTQHETLTKIAKLRAHLVEAFVKVGDLLVRKGQRYAFVRQRSNKRSISGRRPASMVAMKAARASENAV